VSLQRLTSSEDLANRLLLLPAGRDPMIELKEQTKTPMINLNEIKITPRDQQVLRLLVQGCSNKEIASHLNISPRTVKQHLRTLFLRAGIKEGRKRVKLATAMFIKEQVQPCNRAIG
jgi:DNA-binding NarL/FixJ family response regulator